MNTFRNALRKYSKFVYGEKEAGREGVSCMDSRGICIYVCPSYREIRGRRGSLNDVGERSLGNGPASTSTSPAIILELILGSEALTSRQTLVLILQIKERVVRAIEEILIEAHNITLAD